MTVMRIILPMIVYLFVGGLMIGAGGKWHEDKCGQKASLGSDYTYAFDAVVLPALLPALIGTAIMGDHYVSSCGQP